MKKKIAKVMPAGFGHLMLEFEDGVKQMVHRGDHVRHDPKPGDMRPPDDHEQRNERPADRRAQKEGVTWPNKSIT